MAILIDSILFRCFLLLLRNLLIFSKVLDWFITDSNPNDVDAISEQLLGLEYESIKNKLFLAAGELAEC